MAVAVIGGLITSTFLSLLIIPPVFTFVDDIEHFLLRTLARLRGKRMPDSQHGSSGAVVGGMPGGATTGRATPAAPVQE
jgi:hypothetical protein